MTSMALSVTTTARPLTAPIADAVEGREGGQGGLGEDKGWGSTRVGREDKGLSVSLFGVVCLFVRSFVRLFVRSIVCC